MTEEEITRLREKAISRFLSKIKEHSSINANILARDLKESLVEATLMNTGNNQTEASKLLGITRGTLATYNVMKSKAKKVYRKRKSKIYGKN